MKKAIPVSHKITFHSCIINSKKVTITIDSQVTWKNFALAKIVVLHVASTLNSNINDGHLIIHSVFQFLTIILFSLCEKSQIFTVALYRRITHDFQTGWYFSDTEAFLSSSRTQPHADHMPHNVQLLLMLSHISAKAVILSTFS